jgi:hypothetical protein
MLCPKCGKETDTYGKFCNWCGVQLPDVPHKTQIRPFKYSILFKIVVYTDLILSFIMGIGIASVYFSVSSPSYHNPGAFYFFLVYPANFIVDLLLLKNKKQTPNSINITHCWVKGLFGILGFITIISGLYFLINSVKMHIAYQKQINDEFIAKFNRQKESRKENEKERIKKGLEENVEIGKGLEENVNIKRKLEERNERIGRKQKETSELSWIVKLFFYFVLICGISIFLGIVAYSFSNGNYAIGISITIVGIMFGFFTVSESKFWSAEDKT